MPGLRPVVLKGRYELRGLLGKGGMGRVHLGFDRVLGLRQGRLVLDTTPAAVTADQWAALYATDLDP